MLSLEAKRSAVFSEPETVTFWSARRTSPARPRSVVRRQVLDRRSLIVRRGVERMREDAAVGAHHLYTSHEAGGIGLVELSMFHLWKGWPMLNSALTYQGAWMLWSVPSLLTIFGGAPPDPEHVRMLASPLIERDQVRPGTFVTRYLTYTTPTGVPLARTTSSV
jgi:hypothetical protein